MNEKLIEEIAEKHCRRFVATKFIIIDALREYAAAQNAADYTPPLPHQGISDNPYVNDPDCNEPTSRAMRWHNELSRMMEAQNAAGQSIEGQNDSGKAKPASAPAAPSQEGVEQRGIAGTGEYAGYNCFLGAVQGRLLDMGLNAPTWEMHSVRDTGDYEAALDSCVKTMAKLIQRAESAEARVKFLESACDGFEDQAKKAQELARARLREGK